jgi:protein SCO1/2
MAPAGGAAAGVLVPPFSFVDQSGQARTLRDFSGRVVVLTFVYTRCPMPDQCPLMVRHLEYLRRRTEREGLAPRVALLGVTLDPAFDTPEVLRTYGEGVLAGKNRFERWTFATGTPAEIAAIAGYFGIGYSAESGLVTHTLQTVVIGSDGRVLGLFPSNSWRPEEVYDVVRLGADRAAAGS